MIGWLIGWSCSYTVFIAGFTELPDPKYKHQENKDEDNKIKNIMMACRCDTEDVYPFVDGNTIITQ